MDRSVARFRFWSDAVHWLVLERESLRMHIAVVTSDYLDEIGGIAQHVENLSRQLAQHHEVSVIYLARRRPPAQYTDEYGRRICVIHQGESRLARYLAHRNGQVLETLRALQPDIVHVHTLFDAMFMSQLLYPSVYTNHCSTYLKLHKRQPLRRWLLPRVLRKYAQVICPSTELAAKSQHAHVAMIPNGVDLDRFSVTRRATWDRRAFLQANYAVDPGQRTVVLSTRRLVSKNGVLDFVKANAAYLAQRRDELLYLVAGDGEEAGPLRRIVASHGLSNVIMLGAVPHAKVDSLYYSADFCVLPSKMEAISITALEAMAAGAIVVATQVGGLGELLTPGVNSLALGPDLSLEAAMQHEGDLHLLRCSAEALVQSRYSWTSIVRQTIAVYEDVLQRTSGVTCARTILASAAVALSSRSL